MAPIEHLKAVIIWQVSSKRWKLNYIILNKKKEIKKMLQQEVGGRWIEHMT